MSDPEIRPASARNDERLLDALAAADEALDQFEPASGSTGWEILAGRLELVRRMLPREEGHAPRERVPPRIGRYHILGELGSGGFGIVLRAFDPILRREVALKVPRPELLLTAEVRDRFLHEARAAGSLDHHGIVPVLDAGESGTVCYIATALCEGPDLAEWLGRRNDPLPFREAANIAEQVADAVRHAHERGILHRDIKPSNVLMFPSSTERDGYSPRLSDFGLARILEGGPAGVSTSGLPVGSPPYMAPEQAAGRRDSIGPATDVYAIGALLFELLTKRPPFVGESAIDTIRRVLEEEPTRPRWLRPGVPRDLETITMCCLRKEPGRRYRTAAELRDDLRRFQEGKPVLARPIAPWEAAWRWSLRHPSLSALMLVCITAIIAAAASVISANGKLTGLNRELERQTEMAARLNYDARIQLAARSLDEDSVARAQHLLREAEGRYDFKEFSWRYLWNRSRNRGILLGELDHWGRAASLAAGGRLLAVSDAERGLMLFDLEAERMLWSINLEASAQPFTTGTALAFSPDKKSIAVAWIAPHGTSGMESTHIELRGVEDGRLLKRTSVLPRTMVRRILFLKDGASLATFETTPWIDAPVTLALWDLGPTRAGTLRRRSIFRSKRPIQASPDGSVFVDESDDQGVVIRDTATFKIVRELEGGPLPDWKRAAFDPEGREVVVKTGEPTRLILWDVVSGARKAEATGFARPFEKFVLPAGGGSVLFTADNQEVSVLDFKTGKTRVVMPSAEDPENQVTDRVSPTANGEGVLIRRTAHLEPNRIELRSVRDGAVLARPDFPQTGPVDLWIPLADRRGDGLLYSVGRSIWIWRWSPAPKPEPVARHLGEAWTVAFSPSGKVYATGGDDTGEPETIRIWDARTNLQIRGWKGHDATVTSLAFSPDGRILAGASLSAAAPIRLWDVATGNLLREIPWAERRGARAVAWSPDGRLLAAGGTSGLVGLWETSSYRNVLDLHAHEDRVHSLSFSPRGDLLVSAGDDASARTWRVPSGESIGTFRTLTEIAATAFRPDGKRLALCGREGAILLIDPRTGEIVRTIRSNDLELHALAFSPDGRTLASGGRSTRVQLWDPESGQELLTLAGPNARINGVAFSPDGSILVACDHAGGIHVWRTANLDRRP